MAESECKEIRAILGISQRKFAEKYNIPRRTIEEWERGVNHPPEYVMTLLRRAVEQDAQEASGK